MTSLPLLSLLLLAPPIGALLIWLLPGRLSARAMALGVTALTFLLSLVVLLSFDGREAGFQLVETLSWIPTLGIHYEIGVDGLSVLFLPATALLFLAVTLASRTSIRTLPRLYFSLLLLFETATLGVFCALDTMLFFLFWELTLLPIYFLVSLWGPGSGRRYAATKYTLVMLVGGVPLLFGFVLLAFNHATLAGHLSFDLATLLQTPLAKPLQFAVFLLLLVGFAVKAPLFPAHTWLPVMAMEGPAAITAVLVGLKLGAYGLIRFALPLAPDAARELHWLLASLGAIGVLYGAINALAQTNLRRMLAYSSFAHVGLVVLGLASFNLQGIQGAVMLLLNFPLVAGGLFLLTAFLRRRIGSTDVLQLGGAARRLPRLATFFLFLGLAGMGLPGTSGFPAELLIVLSVFKTHTGAGLAVLAGMILSAGYFLSLYRRAFFGPITNPVVGEAVDLQPRELLIMLVLAVPVLWIGLDPSIILGILQPAAETWTLRFH